MRVASTHLDRVSDLILDLFWGAYWKLGRHRKGAENEEWGTVPVPFLGDVFNGHSAFRLESLQSLNSAIYKHIKDRTDISITMPYWFASSVQEGL